TPLMGQTLSESLQPFLKKPKAATSQSREEAWEEWFKLQRLLLGELFFNLQLKAEGGEWVDFLGRLFRSHEAVLRLVFELETRHSTDGNDTSGYPDFEKVLQQKSDLATLPIKPRPTLYSLRQIIQHWVRTGRKTGYGGVLAMDKTLEKL